MCTKSYTKKTDSSTQKDTYYYWECGNEMTFEMFILVINERLSCESINNN